MNGIRHIGNAPQQCLGNEVEGWIPKRSTIEQSLSISRGDITGASPFGAYGKKVTAGAESTSMLWANGIWTLPNQTTGEQFRIVSSSANDTALGTGIRSLHLHYLDNELNPMEEGGTLSNGTTPVLTVATNIRFLQCAHVQTIGSLKQAAGTIAFTNLANTKTYNELDAGELRCSSSLRMVPKGKRAVVYGLIGGSISGSAQASTQINIATSYFGGHDYTSLEILVPIGTVGVQDNSVTYNMPIPLTAPEGTLIGMTCSTTKAATIIGDWFGWLEDV